MRLPGPIVTNLSATACLWMDIIPTKKPHPVTTKGAGNLPLIAETVLSSGIMAAISDQWSDAPSDVLWKIIGQLSIADYIRFGAVCVAWHTVLAEKRCGPVPQAPWLMLHDANVHVGPTRSPVRFLNIFEDKGYKLVIPGNLRWLTCIGSSDSWLIFASISQFHIFNPFSNVQVRHPPISSLAVLLQETITFVDLDIKIVILSGHFSCQSLITAALFHNKLEICREREDSWTSIKISDDGDNVVDIIFYKEQLCALSRSGRVVFYDVSHYPCLTLIIEPPSPFSGHYSNYLLESSTGDLLHVLWSIGETKQFNVFKIDLLTPEIKYVESKCLDGQALFLKENWSLSVSTQDIRELQGNCIYFIYYCQWRVPHMGVYHLGEESFESMPYEWGNGSMIFPLLWFTPKLPIC